MLRTHSGQCYLFLVCGQSEGKIKRKIEGTSSFSGTGAVTTHACREAVDFVQSLAPVIQRMSTPCLNFFSHCRPGPNKYNKRQRNLRGQLVDNGKKWHAVHSPSLYFLLLFLGPPIFFLFIFFYCRGGPKEKIKRK